MCVYIRVAVLCGMVLCYSLSYSDDSEILHVLHMHLVMLTPQCHVLL